jgi:hypothetical protein
MLNMQAVTINANTWSSAGHVVNQIYDLLYMMGRDDIAVGVGGDGGILPNGTILPNVGGYLPIIDQVTVYFCFSTVTEYCVMSPTLKRKKKFNVTFKS